ncbi:MAG: hypothetical protein ACQ9MH_06070 [Nitrospinales bacterium]
MSPQDKLSEKWPWSGEFLRLMLVVPSLMGIAATVALYPYRGVHALWFLTCILAGVAMYLVYGAVGRRVEALKDQVKDGDEWAEGLLVVDKMECPGIILMRSSEVEFVPIVGKRYILPFRDIVMFKEGRWLPGKFVWGKRAFNFGVPSKKRLAFAVAESIGAQWSSILHNR